MRRVLKLAFQPVKTASDIAGSVQTVALLVGVLAAAVFGTSFGFARGVFHLLQPLVDPSTSGRKA
jgi:hypothetical protein